MSKLEEKQMNPNEVKGQEQRKALGRGLAALIGEQSVPSPSQNIVSPKFSIEQVAKSEQVEKVESTAIDGQIEQVELSKIFANPEQPRKHFNQALIQELSDSIKEHGLLQPIVVVPKGQGQFQIVAGERRFRASQLAQMQKIPVIVKRDPSFGQNAQDLVALVENLQREDLGPIELAIAYQRVLSLYKWSQEELAKKLGVSRVAVANTLRLTKLPEQVKKMVNQKLISEGHARALLGFDNESEILSAAEEVVAQSMTVRQTEDLVRDRNRAKVEAIAAHPDEVDSGDKRLAPTHSSDMAPIESELRHLFGTKVVVRGNGHRGTVELFYTGKDSLSRILNQLRSIRDKQ
jgi:ParB family transcriptional regulator, chromosome partitioning protein